MLQSTEKAARAAEAYFVSGGGFADSGLLLDGALEEPDVCWLSLLLTVFPHDCKHTTYDDFIPDLFP